MRSFAIPLVASAAGTFGATMQINDSNFQDHMAVTVLEGLFGMEGQQMPAVSGQQNIVDMIISKLANINMDKHLHQRYIRHGDINLEMASLQGHSVLQLQHPTKCLHIRQAHLHCHHPGQASRQPKQKPDPVQGHWRTDAVFYRHNLPNPNIAPSYSLAGVLEGIQRGTAIALGKSNDTFGNPSSLLWANFSRKVRAFQIGLNYGVQVSDRLTGTTPSVTDYIEIPERAAVFKILTAWTILAQNEGVIGRIFSLIFETGQANASQSAPVVFLPLLPYGFTTDKFINWIFNVSDPKPLYCLVDAAFNNRQIAVLRIDPATFLNDINNLIITIPAFLRCYSVGANI